MQELNRRCHDDTCQEAADRAVKKVFVILGVDVDKPESVEEFREDLRFGKRMRKAADHGLLAVMGVIAAAAMAALATLLSLTDTQIDDLFISAKAIRA